jgi:hypothetical protein
MLVVVVMMMMMMMMMMMVMMMMMMMMEYHDYGTMLPTVGSSSRPRVTVAPAFVRSAATGHRAPEANPRRGARQGGQFSSGLLARTPGRIQSSSSGWSWALGLAILPLGCA